jgi:hypothetical protein
VGANRTSENVKQSARTAEAVPLWQDYRFLAAALPVLTAAVVVAFR